MKIKPSALQRIIEEETKKALINEAFRIHFEGDELGDEKDQEGSKDEVGAAKDQGMKSDVVRVAKFMFKNKQLGPALEKIKGNVEAAQLLGLLAQELGVDPGDISNVMAKVKKGMGDKTDDAEEATADAAKQGGDDELAEAGRYFGSDPQPTGNPTVDALADIQRKVAEFATAEGENIPEEALAYIDDAVRNLHKAMEDVRYRQENG